MFANRAFRIAMTGTVVSLLILVGVVPTMAQESESPVAPEFHVSHLELKPSAGPKTVDGHGLGYVPPPVDLSHLTGDIKLSVWQEYVSASDPSPKPLPASFDWRDEGGNNYVTGVKDQGACGSCYAFASLGNFEARVNIHDNTPATSPSVPTVPDYSEENAMECNWQEINNYSYGGNAYGGCAGGNYWMVASLLSQKGTVLESCNPYSADDSGPCNTTCPYQKTLLDWSAISGEAIPDPDTLKYYIMEYGPVYTTLYSDGGYGFNGSYDGSYTFDWYPGTGNPGVGIDHAVMIVGWSDNLPPVQGDTEPADGWIVKNSWGADWGDDGYFYITYGSANIGWYSSFVEKWQDYDSSGGVMLYDEAGTLGAGIGVGDGDDWGLCRFVPSSAVDITRIEFWTSNPVDISAYLYDDFNGSTLSNLLWSSTGHSYNNAGYHSIPVGTPIVQGSGDDIIAVIRFEVAPSGEPFKAIPVDIFATPFENDRTFISDDGITWTDSGFAGLGDVGIRLRYTKESQVYTLDVSKSGNGSVTPSVGTHEYPQGMEVDLTAIPNSGWVFAGWTGEVATIADVNDPTTTITMNDDYAITAHFTQPGHECDAMVAAGYHHTVGLKTDGTAIAVGSNVFGQCSVGGWTNLQQIAAGANFTVGLKSDGSVVATGENDYGQCNVGSWSDIQQISAGHYHTVGLKSDGTVIATGRNGDGQCEVSTWQNIQQVAANGFHTVGLTLNGNLIAVGANDYGQCDIEGWSGIEQVSSGGWHTLGMKSNGEVLAVGANDWDQCEVNGWSGVKQISGGLNHSIGLRHNGELVAEGNNDFAQCDIQTWPVIAQVSAGHWHTVGVTPYGRVLATGYNEDDQCEVADWDLDELATEKYLLTITSTSGGSVETPGEGSFECLPGTVVNLEAVPDGNSMFVAWLGDTGSIADVNDPTTTIMMTGDLSIHALFLSQGPFDSIYRAVICGISDYEGSYNDLDYCDDDAKGIYDKLVGFPNFSAGNIQLLLDSDATEDNIHAAIDSMLAQADSNDVCLFYFSGHGGYGTDQAPYDEADGFDEYLCPYNIMSEEILDDELSAWLGASPTSNIIVWIDTCFSGGNLKASSDVNVKFYSGEPIAGKVRKGDGFTADFQKITKDINDLPAPYISTASDDDEFSIESSALKHGLYTYYLLKALDVADDDEDEWVSAEETFDYLYDLVVSYPPYSNMQHPQEYDAYPGEAKIGQYGIVPTSIIVLTQEATNVNSSSAVLNGILADPGESTPVNVSFEYGTVSGLYSHQTAGAPMSSPGMYSQSVDGLQPNTKYFFRARGDGDGTAWGIEKNFMTNALGTVYVDGNAAGAGNGESWEDAYTNLQTALAEVEAGEQIWVAAGTYTPAPPGQPGTRSDCFQLKNSVGIYGGFSGTETELHQRDFLNNQTILSGDIGVAGYAGDNCYHIFSHPKTLSLNNSAVLDGVIISGGNANGVGNHQNNGGGMFNDQAHPAISNCVFKGNSSGFMGGGMLNFGFSAPTVTNCVFVDNTAHFGGGMCNEKESAPAVTNCVFYDNNAVLGGGLFNNQQAFSVITNTIFWNNQADEGDSLLCGDSSAAVSYCNVQVSSGTSVFPGPGNINEPPGFRSGHNGDFHLRYFSPCIDAGANTAQGLPSKDVDGDLRIVGFAVDMGIDEYTPGCIELSPDSGLPASEITVHGYNFGGTPVRISVGGSPVTSVGNLEDLDGDSAPGFFEGVPVIFGIDDFEINIQIPRIVDTSTVEIKAVCYDPLNEATFTAVADFDVSNPKINLQPNTGPPGTDFFITGSGFPANEPDETWNHGSGGIALYKYIYGLSMGTLTSHIATDGNGSFSASGQIPYDALPGVRDIILFFDPTDPVYKGDDPDELATRQLFMVTSAGTKVIYVDASNTGVENGESWETAYTDLQEGLDAAYIGDEIWVASGVYNPTLVHGGSEPRYRSFQMKDEVSILGGFQGNETYRDQRNWQKNATVLSGDIGVPGNMADNCYHVFYHPDTIVLSGSAVLDGFTITGGNADGPSLHRHGGGMFNHHCSPTIINCTFWQNSACLGGGMKNFIFAAPSLVNSVFSNNSADFGGGIHNDYNSSPTVLNCTFFDNTATQNGGGICSSNDSIPLIANTILWGDTADSEGDELYCSPGTPMVFFSDVQVNSGTYTGVANINQDPLWADPVNGDYRLQENSPCIDSGDDFFAIDIPWDFECQPRINDGDDDGYARVDIGADEFMAITTYTLTMAKSGDGAIIPAAGDHVYGEGEVVDVSATSDPNWHFNGWTGNTDTVADVNDLDTTITMNDNYAVTGNFRHDMWLYDVNPEDGAIQVGEFLAALSDYLNDQIAVSRLLEVLNLYLQS